MNSAHLLQKHQADVREAGRLQAVASGDGADGGAGGAGGASGSSSADGDEDPW